VEVHYERLVRRAACTSSTTVRCYIHPVGDADKGFAIQPLPIEFRRPCPLAMFAMLDRELIAMCIVVGANPQPRCRRCRGGVRHCH
jgi:hypothetical protein